MKKHVVSFLLLLFVQQICTATFYDQLCEFNYNWKKYSEQAPQGEAKNFDSEADYIEAHLAAVISILRTNPVDYLSAEQYKSRLFLIEVLDEYRAARKFPINYYRHERIPVFIDEHNTHCAVGFLLQQTGYEEVALRISRTDNYVWVKDIADPALPVWQKASGFSMEELKLIQGAYDFYMPGAFYLPNKYEVPQKPECITAYFENENGENKQSKKQEFIWLKGEGANGVLNGRWEQNASAGMPWIVGFYENGKRTGQWEEYYQGTKQLCRTENWRNDKLNGIRRRFNRVGILIEEILFKEGKAVTKTNYDLQDSLTYVRTPIDSILVWTEVYNHHGAMIASGHETVHNPSGLLWFQDIELTALNSVSITARNVSTSTVTSFGTGTNSIDDQLYFRPYGARIFNPGPALVEYKKEGDWIYHKEYAPYNSVSTLSNSVEDMFKRNYFHFGVDLYETISVFENLRITSGYDSIRVEYKDGLLESFYGYGNSDFVHLRVGYYDFTPRNEQHEAYYRDVIGMWDLEDASPKIKMIGQYNRENERIGEWLYFDKNGELYKIENYIIPRKDEDE